MFMDIVSESFKAGARMTNDALDFLPGDTGEQLKMLLLYLDQGMDPNARMADGEPLLGFFDYGCARELLIQGAGPNVSGPYKKIPLHRAMIVGATALAERLLEHGTIVKAELLFVTAAPRRTYGEIMTKLLLDRGADSNVTNEEWSTPLHLAVYAEKLRIVKMLLDASADPTQKSGGRLYSGLTPPEIATHPLHPHSDLTQVLLDLLRSREAFDITS